MEESSQNNYKKKLIQARLRKGVRSGLNEVDKLDYDKNGKIGLVAGDAVRLAKIGLEMESGHEIKAFIEATKLVLALRKQIKEGKDIPFLLLLILASAGDVIDLINLALDFLAVGLVIPPLGIMARIIIFFIMFFSLWGKGNFVKKIVLRIIMVTVIESIPFPPFSFIALLPIETLAILWIWRNTHKKIKKAESQLEIVDNELRRHGNKLDELKKIENELMQ